MEQAGKHGAASRGDTGYWSWFEHSPIRAAGPFLSGSDRPMRNASCPGLYKVKPLESRPQEVGGSSSVLCMSMSPDSRTRCRASTWRSFG